MANVKKVLTDTLTANEKVTTKVIKADTYENLPIASKTKAGVIKIDGITLKIVDGVLSVVEVTDDDTSIEDHISNLDIHLNESQVKAIEDFLKHKNDNTHMTSTEKKNIEDHIKDKNIHLSQEDKNSINSMKEHMQNELLHFVGKEKQEFLSNFETLKKHIENGDIHFTKAEKDSVLKNINDFIEHIENANIHLTEELLNKINKIDNNDNLSESDREALNSINTILQDIARIFEHIADTSIHFTMDGINETIDEVRDSMRDLEDNLIDLGNKPYFYSNNHDADKILITNNSGEVDYHKMSASNLFITSKGMKGQLAILNKDNNVETTNRYLLNDGIFCSTQEELDNAKVIGTNFQEIFETWRRFAHLPTTENQPSDEEDMNSWEYRGETNTVHTTKNADSFTGFASNNRYKDYIHEATFRANNSDDDWIGLLIAFAVEKNGRECTLSVNRVRNGKPYFGLYYNFSRSDEWLIGYVDKLPGDDIDGHETNTPETSWSIVPVGTRVKVIKKDDKVTVMCSPFNSETYDETSKITVDLNSDERLIKFKGYSSYGYCAKSQLNASWCNISFNGLDSIVWDLRTAEGWVYNGTSWVIDPNLNLYEDVGIGVILYDRITTKLYFVKNVDNIITIVKNNPSSSYALIESVSERPILDSTQRCQYFDENLGIPIWWNGTEWIKYNGEKV